MKWSTWHVVRFGFDARFGVMRSRAQPRGRLAAVEYHQVNGKRWEAASRDAAQREADRLNGLAALPRRITSEQFEAATGHVPMRPSTRTALRAIMVEGRTWKQAAKLGGITESGILRAMRRVEERNRAA